MMNLLDHGIISVVRFEFDNSLVSRLAFAHYFESSPTQCFRRQWVNRQSGSPDWQPSFEQIRPVTTQIERAKARAH